ncbi:hypothetical protein [Deinococcus hopiensis]|uniref:Uncharacterized protein n=1 Tax=Deinococcus hopiensis KR-140 TaxID=695939 RepID=A0A1W1UYT8_9DEIO|nr:hypothetical protein [Deinococcus hopiensis]SMB86263.1 hypothetical protein SAMN00790413_03744 [Deinococcus hopiensis KR-140]
MKLRLSDFLTNDCGIHRTTSLDEIKILYPGNYTVYTPEEYGVYQVHDLNLCLFIDSKGPTWIEFSVTVDDGFQKSEVLDLQGLLSSNDADFIAWCHEMGIAYEKNLLESDEYGDTYLLKFPSGADVLISRNSIQRIAKLY